MKERTKYAPIKYKMFTSEISGDNYTIEKDGEIIFNGVLEEIPNLITTLTEIRKTASTIEPGDMFGDWTIEEKGKVEYVGIKNEMKQYWIVSCECGARKEVTPNYLRTQDFQICKKCNPKKRGGWAVSEIPEDIDKHLEGLPAKSYQRKNLFLGIGINDAPFQTSKRFQNKTFFHSAYSDWAAMITRCYQNKETSYKGCLVSEDWHTFSTFLLWWKNNRIDGFALDKDLFEKDFKYYSSETCCFLPNWLNSAIAHKKKNTLNIFGLHQKGDNYYIKIKLLKEDYSTRYSNLKEFKADWVENILPKWRSSSDWKILPERVKEKLEEVFSYPEIS